MTREEEIRNAVDTIIPISPSRNGRTYEQSMMATGFEAGVKWADENPKSPWISVKDDLPCNHEELLDPSCEYNETVIVLTACGNDYYNNWMKLGRNGEWVWHSIKNVTHWMKLPELPKEEENKL